MTIHVIKPITNLVGKNRIKLCKVKGCRDEATTEGLCRFHYLKNWKKMMKDKKKSEEQKEKFINVLADKYQEGLPGDADADEIIGRSKYDHPLSEVGIREKDIKKKSDDNPLFGADLDYLIDNMRYDENY